ncbi:5'-nucleotidase yjjG [Vibrio nigripulchritudo MADA3029]|nr:MULTISPECIES: pyrimidine 5'-nucleotidase [Vibrio]KJY74727.1 dUMP phosphatase [Vibrio nigripulchritudo]UAB73937.1 pyrimidine 5'-nucleotidase [Vibrio sp. SCSIO 43132]CCN47525.1 5'-nucleotidase yjjG [Vibrio nigripulchritudo MADA3020]CCN55933.1 5'-nucleotidase yjjG [Vibrio nigripulchritudo MADA3021]CCN57156.1 5'-nucleotidase yjjG [Vibrio nigripulchritudo MADA3029]
MKYSWILFDADETLFSFDAFKGLQTMFSRLDVNFTQADFEEYQLVNKPLWVKYQDGEINAKQLQEDRFVIWGQKLSLHPSELNEKFLDAMADICQPLPHVPEVLELISKKAKLGIITNGFTQLQSIRLEKTGLSQYFEHVIISEEVGIAKPDVAIFDAAFEKMGHPNKDKILMVGDNPHSDVLGGLNAGIETCWLNTEGANRPEGIDPHHEVKCWKELQQLLLP